MITRGDGAPEPKGEPAVAGDVSFSYQDMEQARATFEKDAAEMEDSLRKLKGLVNTLIAGPFKTQKASGAFAQAYENIDKGGEQVLQGLQGLGKFLHAAVQGAQQLDEQLKQQAGGG